jgi:hypothetical protein
MYVRLDGFILPVSIPVGLVFGIYERTNIIDWHTLKALFALSQCRIDDDVYWAVLGAADL